MNDANGSAPRYRLGIDVGGTFTDAVLIDQVSGEMQRAKVMTTPEDQSRGTMEGFESFAVDPAQVEFFCHGSTVGINALIQRRGAKVGLICTRGTRDLLDRGRLRRPYGDDLYDPTWQRPHSKNPIVERRFIREIDARMLWDGSTYVDVDLDQVAAEVEFLKSDGVDSIAVCLLHSWKNLEHEEAVVETIRRVHPDAYVQWSAVRPVYGEYNRTLSCVLDAYVAPPITSYLNRLAERFAERSFPSDVFLMQMNGGTRTLEQTIRDFPAYMIESGPAAGALGAEHYARHYLATDNLVCMDIGGTSTDLVLIIDGDAQSTEEWQFEFNMPLGMPAIDIRSLGAGGGSIVGIDDIGTLTVGPDSAGARPGPAAYGFGGELPTITDAYVALGIVQPGLFMGGQLSLDRDAAVAALTPLAERLDLDVLRLAAGAVELMNVQIENEISQVAFEQAVDPRDFSLLGYGGAGGIHAAHVARRLGLKSAVIPVFPGGFSALGMVTAPVKVERARSLIEPLSELGAAGLNAVFEEMRGQIAAELERQGVDPAEIRFERSLHGLYEGQSFDNPVRFPAGIKPLAEADLEGWLQAFHELYDRVYGYSAPEIPVIVTTASLIGYGSTPAPPIAELATGRPEPAADAVGRRARAALDGEMVDDVPFYRRDRLLAGNRVAGPAVIDDQLGTIVVPDRCTAVVDRFGGLEIVF